MDPPANATIRQVIQIGPVPAKAPDGYPNEMPDYAYSTPEKPVYLADWQYSQGFWSWQYTEDPLQAMNLLTTKYNVAMAADKFIKSGGGKLCHFKVIVEVL